MIDGFISGVFVTIAFYQLFEAVKRFKKRRAYIVKSSKQTVFIEGRVIGYQFNQKSIGSRTVHCKVRTFGNIQYCRYMGMRIRVLPLHADGIVSSSLFQAVGRLDDTLPSCFHQEVK